MFGLFFLVLIGLYLVVIIKIFKHVRPVAVKIPVLAMVVIVPAICRYWYRWEPAYEQFLELCETVALVRLSDVEADYLYRSSCSSQTFRTLKQHGYLGVECKRYSGAIGTPERKLRKFRYTRGESWDKPVCDEEQCGHESGLRETSCSFSCLDEVEISSFKNLYRYEYEKNNIIENKLTENIARLVDENEGTLAYANSYIYYPYGDTWARVLGGSSAMAPKKVCGAGNGLYDEISFYNPTKKDLSTDR